jgi:hypothetical protein
MLRMGKKYRIAKFTDEARRRLEIDFPDNWRTYTQNQGAYQEIIFLVDENISHLLKLLLEHGPRSVLPAAYLDLIAKGFQQILAYSLPASILNTLILGGTRFFEESCQLSALLKQDCADIGCNALRQDRLISWVGSGPLPYHQVFVERLAEWTEGLCATCQERIAQDHPLMMDKIWAQLPSMFDMPPWAQLHDEDGRRFPME